MPSSEVRSSGLRVAITVFIALIFAILPLPAVIEPAKPHLLLLFVIYWALSSPRVAGLMFAWFCGLAIDLLKGPSASMPPPSCSLHS
jgi:rod shape-determining protein MreD